MSTIKAGDRVAISFRATTSDRQLVASSGEEPFVLTAGGKELLPVVSDAVIGMSVGESKVLHIEGAAAFGMKGEKISRTMPRSRFPADVGVGDAIRISRGQVSALLWVIGEGAGDTWHLCTRHPLADRDFEVQLTVQRVV